MWQGGERKWGENHNNHKNKTIIIASAGVWIKRNSLAYHNTNLHSKIVTLLVSFVAVASCGHVTQNGRCRWKEVCTTMWLLGAMSGLVTCKMRAARIPLRKCKNRHTLKINEKWGTWITSLQLEFRKCKEVQGTKRRYPFESDSIGSSLIIDVCQSC